MKRLSYTLILAMVFLLACNSNNTKPEEPKPEQENVEAPVMDEPAPCENEISTETANTWADALMQPGSMFDYTHFNGVEIPKRMICHAIEQGKDLNFVFDYVGEAENAHHALHLTQVTEVKEADYTYVCSPIFGINLPGNDWQMQEPDCATAQEMINGANERWSSHLANGPKSFIVPIDDLICLNKKLANDCSGEEWKGIYIQLGLEGENVKLIITNVKDMKHAGDHPVYLDACTPCPDICAHFI